jgi:hypothetical protein
MLTGLVLLSARCSRLVVEVRDLLRARDSLLSESLSPDVSRSLFREDVGLVKPAISASRFLEIEDSSLWPPQLGFIKGSALSLTSRLDLSYPGTGSPFSLASFNAAIYALASSSRCLAASSLSSSADLKSRRAGGGVRLRGRRLLSDLWSRSRLR